MIKCWKLWACVLASLGLVACDDSSSSHPTTVTNQCEVTGGSLQADGKCVCGGETCELATWCTSDGKCGVELEINFAFLCVSSGGEASGNTCTCSGEACDEGVLCDTFTHKCPKKTSGPTVNPSGSCKGFQRSCHNGPLQIGIVSDCVSGVEFERSCVTVSCNESGTDCGECLNDIQSCTNDDERIGKVTKCANGKKEVDPCDGVSCDGNKCGSCLNYERTCMDEEVKVDVNGTEVFKEIGRIYQCEDGRTGKLVLDCKNTSCYSWKKIYYGEDGKPHFMIDEEKTAARHYTVYVKIPADEIACGECINFDVKCENDLSDFGHKYRCQLGQWSEIVRDDDPEALKPGAANIQLFGYYPIDGGDPKWFVTQLGAHTQDGKWDFGVSCNKEGTDFGVCHNSVQICVNEERGKRGYIVKCEHGALADYDGGDEKIACHCMASGNNNGGCSSGRNCYAAQTFANDKRICDPPTPGDKDTWDPNGDPKPKDD